MEAKKLCCGIDVSHATLDVCYQNNLGELFHLQVGNNNKGFEKILEHTGIGYHFVMEATGVYYIRLAFYLHSRGCALSVANAIAIKRYIQMHLERNKTDKKDAGWICRYAVEQQPAYWQMPDSAYSSGTSIQAKPRIYKRGGKNLRDVLYMCSMNAMKTNTACKALYERLRANGKTGKQALIAVCNKLLKQVFAVVKNNSLYQPNYCSAKP